MFDVTAQPVEMDAVVVGAGVIGACCALSLVQEGKKTLLIDQVSGKQALIIMGLFSICSYGHSPFLLLHLPLNPTSHHEICLAILYSCSHCCTFTNLNLRYNRGTGKVSEILPLTVLFIAHKSS